jgi:hypothetical protein
MNDIKEHFISLYHKQANCRTEHFSERIHKSLKILYTNSKPTGVNICMQAVAMYYRYAPMTNLGLSPFEIIYGRTMIQNSDWHLTASEPPVLGPHQYFYEIRPKLTILHQIELANARDNAQRHHDRVNQDVTIPTYKQWCSVVEGNAVGWHPPNNLEAGWHPPNEQVSREML